MPEDEQLWRNSQSAISIVAKNEPSSKRKTQIDRWIKNQ